jgi:hypothetical protein
MADGRKLRARLRFMAASFEDKILDSEPPLITSDYPAWVSHPFEGSHATDDSVDVPFRQGKLGLPDTDHLSG